jgi:hypothetical protein
MPDAMDELGNLDPGNVPAEQVERLIAEIDPAQLDPALFRDLLAAVGSTRIDLSGVSPTAFATLISRASREQIEAVSAAEPVRRQVLDEIFARMTGQFRAHRAGSAAGVAHWLVGDKPGGGHDGYQMVIEDGSCEITRELDREPRLTLSMGIVEFIRLVSGNANAPMMFLTGKLKIRGDLPFAVNMLGFFDIPKPA